MKVLSHCSRSSSVCGCSHAQSKLHNHVSSIYTSCNPQQRHMLSAATNSSSGYSSNSSLFRRSVSGRQRRHVVARMYRTVNDELADVTREVWDDEEDIQAAAAKLGYDKDTLEADSGPLITNVNEWYVEQKYPKEGFLGQVELRYIPSKGYGLVATNNIAQGTVLAVCLPLAWVSGPAGQPPPLEALVGLLRSSPFTAQQRRVFASMCSNPDLDLSHEGAVMAQQQQLQQDALLKAAQELQKDQAPGFAAGSLPLSRAAAIQRQQKQLKAAAEYSSWDLDDEESNGYDDGYDGAMTEDNSDYDADDADYDVTLRQQGRMAGRAASVRVGARRLAGSNARQLLGSSGSSSGWGLTQQQRGYNHARRTPDLLEYLECTTPPAAADNDAAGAAAGFGPSAAASGGGSSSSSSSGGVRGLPLNLPLDRLSALVCRNALLELSQDLITTSIRQDIPASLTGIWPLLSLFNHSCAPNAVAVAIGYQQPPQQQTLLQQPEQQQGQLGVSQPPVNPWAVQQQGRKPDSSSSSRGGGGGDSSSSGVAKSGGGGGGGLTYCAAAGVGPFVLVRTVSDLAAGDEVVLDYLAGGLEGSLVHGERRRAALAERWGFKCRCERCQAEEKLGPAVSTTLKAGNTLAARMGPKVAAAATAAAAAAAAAAADASKPGPTAAASNSGDGRDQLQRYAGQLSGVIQELEKAVDHPRIPPRAAAWAHASVYQVHALYAVCRGRLSPTTPAGLTPLGTAAELVGLSAPGSAVHVLGMAHLVTAAADAWGAGDIRVEGALQALMKVCQTRYGPLQAGVASLLCKGAQLWAHRTEDVTLALLSPAAAAAVQARKHLWAQQQQQQQDQAVGKSDLAGFKNSDQGGQEEEGERDELAAELALQADEVVDVDDFDIEEMYGEDTDTAAAASVQEAQSQRAAAARGTPAVSTAAAAAAAAEDDLMFVRKRSESDVLQELQLYAGYRAALPAEQQQQQQYTSAAAGQSKDFTPQQQQQQQLGLDAASATQTDPTAAAAAAGVGDAGVGSDEGEGYEGVEEVPLLTSWLQGGDPAATAAAVEELTATPLKQKQQQQQQQSVGVADQGSKGQTVQIGSSSSSSSSGSSGSGKGVGEKRQVASLFGGKGSKPQRPAARQQQQQQPDKPPASQQRQQQQPSVDTVQGIGGSVSATPATHGKKAGSEQGSTAAKPVGSGSNGSSSSSGSAGRRRGRARRGIAAQQDGGSSSSSSSSSVDNNS